jgi:hypothetical protein
VHPPPPSGKSRPDDRRSPAGFLRFSTRSLGGRQAAAG